MSIKGSFCLKNARPEVNEIQLFAWFLRIMQKHVFMVMLVEDVIERQKIIGQIILDFSKQGITNFGEWLNHYESTMNEVENFVNDYVIKVNDDKLDEIEKFQKVIMLNALALYIVELDIDDYDLGNELVDNLFKIYVTTIWNYNRMLKGEMKLIGPVFISDISLFKFIEI